MMMTLLYKIYDGPLMNNYFEALYVCVEDEHIIINEAICFVVDFEKKKMSV
jgi:hypothetical protein